MDDKEYAALTSVLAKALECDPDTLGPDSGLGKHYRWDSVGHIAIMVALERHFGIKVNSENVRKFTSVASIKHAVRSNHSD